MSNIESSNKELWLLISGVSILWPQEVVKSELDQNKKKLNSLLDYYTNFENSETQPFLPSFPGLSENFLSKLSDFLDLKKEKCFLICQSFFNEFHSSENLQEIMASISSSSSTLSSQSTFSISSSSTEAPEEELMKMIRKFYYNEKISLLKIFIFILINSSDPSHPYYISFKQFIDEINSDELFEKIFSQYKKLIIYIDENVKNKNLYNNTLLKQQRVRLGHGNRKLKDEEWMRHHLQEAFHFLHLFLLHQKIFPPKYEQISSFMDFIKEKDKFSWLEGQKSEEGQCIQIIGFLQTLVVLGGIELELVLEKFLHSSNSKEPSNLWWKDTILNENFYKAINTSLSSLTTTSSSLSNQCFSPIFLAWSIVQRVRGNPMFVATGNASLQFGVFQYLLKSLEVMEELDVDESLIIIVKSILFGLVNCLLSLFDEESLGKTQYLDEIIVNIIDLPFLGDAFWEMGEGQGIKEYCLRKMEGLPLDLQGVLPFLTSLSKASASSCRQVIKKLKNLNHLTEVLTTNTPISKVTKVPSNQLETMVFEVRSPTPYYAYSIFLPNGTQGTVTTATKEPSLDCIIWQKNYDCFEVLLLEAAQLIRVLDSSCAPHPPLIQRTLLSLSLFSQMLSTDCGFVFGSVKQIGEFLECCLQIIQKLGCHSNPPQDLLTTALNLLTHAYPLFKQEIWRSMQLTDFLPSFQQNLSNLHEAFKCVNSGEVGRLLASCQVVTADYKLLIAYLEFILKEAKSPWRRGDLVASLMFICQEIFINHSKWKFMNYKDKLYIRKLCLKIFREVMDERKKKIVDGEEKSGKEEDEEEEEEEIPINDPEVLINDLSDKSCLLYNLLLTDMGGHLVEICGSVEVDTLEKLIASQNSFDKGVGSEICTILNLSLSVLNKLVIDHNPLCSHSNLVNRIFMSPPQTQWSSPKGHFIRRLSSFIFHRHHVSLTTQAVLVLKNLALIQPMSMLACLQKSVFSIRDVYYERIRAVTEVVSLKKTILEWLTACMQTQPGLVEIFINNSKPEGSLDPQEGLLNPPESLDSPQIPQPPFQQNMCMQIVVDLIKKEFQNTYKCSLDLLSSVLEFFHMVWKTKQNKSINFLNNNSSFWDSLLHCTITSSSSSSSFKEKIIIIKCLSHSLRTFALQLFYSNSNPTGSAGNFTPALQFLLSPSNISQISKFISNSASQSRLNPENLLLAWRDLVTTLLVTKVTMTPLGVEEDEGPKVRDDIVEDLFFALNNLMNQLSSAGTKKQQKLFKLISILSSLLPIIMNRWNNPSFLQNHQCHLGNYTHILSYLSTFSTPFPFFLSLIQSLILYFQNNNASLNKEEHQDKIKEIFALLCQFVHLPHLFIYPQPSSPPPKPMNSSNHPSQPPVTLGNEKKSEKERNYEHELKQLPVSLLRLLKQLLGSSPIHSQVNSIHVQTLEDHSVIPCLMDYALNSIHDHSNLGTTQGILSLFLTLSLTNQGCWMLLSNQFDKNLTLPICSFFDEKQLFHSKSNLEVKEFHHTLLLLLLHTSTHMLERLQLQFLSSSLNILSCFKLRAFFVFNNLIKSFSEVTPSKDGDLGLIWYHSYLEEAESFCMLICTLSRFHVEWKRSRGVLMEEIMAVLNLWTQKLIGLMVSPKTLVKMLQGFQSNQNKKKSIHFADEVCPLQQRILKAVSYSLTSLRNLSPLLHHVLFDQRYEQQDQPWLLTIDFASPSVHDSCPPSLGMLISLFNFSIDILSKFENQRHQSPAKQKTMINIDKKLVFFVIDQIVYLILTHSLAYLQHPSVQLQDKQVLKRDLSSELTSCIVNIHRYVKAPSASPLTPHRASLGLPINFSFDKEHELLALIDQFIKSVLK